MPHYYFSGVDHEKHFPILVAERARALLSALTVEQPRILRQLESYPDMVVALDSWAFPKRDEVRKSNEVRKYAQLIMRLESRFPHRFQWYANADVIGDQRASDERYAELLSLLPENLHQRVLWVYQCTDLDDQRNGFAWLRAACAEHGRIGLGGLVSLLKKDVGKAFRLLQAIGQVLDSFPACPRVHVFGVASPFVLAWLRFQPWFESADSSKCWIAFKSSEVLFLSGDQRRVEQADLALTPSECAALNIRSVLSWVDPMRARQLQLFREEEQLALGDTVAHGMTPAVNREQWRGRIVLAHDRSESFFRPSFSVYVPLFTYRLREYGLLGMGEGADITPEREWAIVWDPHDPRMCWQARPRAEDTLIFLDERPKMGLLNHSYGFVGFPFHQAVSVASALVAGD